VGDTVPTTRTANGVTTPWFAAPTLEGDTVAIADLRGSPVLVNLWATWCPPCRNEMPYLQSVHERYGGALRTVGISLDNRGAWDQVRDFLDESGVTYEILLDPSMRSLDLFDLPGLPGTFLLDPAGAVTFARIGPVIEGEAAFEGALERLMGSPAGPGEDP
jgi:thiol-disulfide isomerase/thioredoxin